MRFCGAILATRNVLEHFVKPGIHTSACTRRTIISRGQTSNLYGPTSLLRCQSRPVFTSRSFASVSAPKQNTRSGHDKKPLQRLHKRILDESVVNEQVNNLKASLKELSDVDSFGTQRFGDAADTEHVAWKRTKDSSRTVKKNLVTASVGKIESFELDEASDADSFGSQKLAGTEKGIIGQKSARDILGKSLNNYRAKKNVIDNSGESVNTLPESRSSSDENYDLHSGDWSESFGTLSDDLDKFLAKYSTADGEGEVSEPEKPYRRLSETGRKHYPDWYGRKIANLGRAGKVYEAMEMLEKQMLKEDRVLPNQYVFTVLIGVLGRVGYTKKAFHLFNKMKQFGLKPQDPTYTALFNACSNSPWPADGLQRTNHLRQQLRDRDITPNIITFNSMIKAYARCGDVKTAFEVADEALAAGIKMRAVSFTFILMACIADKTDGLRMAIQVWLMMRQRHLRPSTYHYNLLLRAVRDCGVGDSQTIQQLLLPPPPAKTVAMATQSAAIESPVVKKDKRSVGDSRQARSPTDSLLLAEDAEADKTLEVLQTDSSLPNNLQLTGRSDLSVGQYNESAVCLMPDVSIPDLLDPHRQPVDAGSIQLTVPTTPDGRLALLGGMDGILQRMKRDRATPDIKTFTLFLDTLPLTRSAEADLLASMSLNSVKPDADFCSLLIRKRTKRHDIDGAKEVLELMERLELKPTVRTFGCLAMGCSKKDDAVRLLHQIRKAGLLPNIEICEILEFQSRMDFTYKLLVLRTMTKHNIRPNAKIIERLEEDITAARQIIIKKERGESVPEFYSTEYFTVGYRQFLQQYRRWLLSTEAAQPVHPWTPYRQPTPTVEKMKVPDELPSKTVIVNST